MKIGTIFYFIIKLYTLKIVISDVSHLPHHGVFGHLYHQSLYETPQQITPKPGLPPTVITTTEFFFPEIIINKRAKPDSGYDYPRPIKPPYNTYIPPPSSDDLFKPIDTTFIQQIPDEIQQFELPNEVFPDSPTLIEPNNNISSLLPQGYLPPVSQDRTRLKSFESDGIFVTYDKNAFGGYDYNIPTTRKPSNFIPKPVEEADVVLDENHTETNVDKIPIQGYNYEVPIFQNFSSTPLPDNIDQPQNGYLPPIPSSVSIRHSKDLATLTTNTNNAIKLQLKEMRCLNNQNGFFKAILRLDSFIELIPIIDNDIIDSRCELKLIQSHIIVNIAAEDFLRCGIRICGEHLCMRMRFPLIPEMKTAADSILTLQCKMQEKIITKTHALKMDVANDIQGRSVGALAQGGIQQPFRTHIDLLRKSSNGFTKRLEPHGSVRLGEELLLRTHVNSGDGWNYTKLTDVNLQRISSSGEILNSANLITSYGCINPSMRPICPVQPSFDPPLGHRLSFKVVMFQGMHSGEEIVMSIKITGCIERADCYVNSQYCNNSFNRLKRSLNKSKIVRKNLSEFEEISKISFRVIIPDDDNGQFLKKPYIIDDSNNNIKPMLFLIVGSIGIVSCCSFLIVFIYLKFCKKYSNKNFM